MHARFRAASQARSRVTVPRPPARHRPKIGRRLPTRHRRHNFMRGMALHQQWEENVSVRDTRHGASRCPLARTFQRVPGWCGWGSYVPSAASRRLSHTLALRRGLLRQHAAQALRWMERSVLSIAGYNPSIAPPPRLKRAVRVFGYYALPCKQRSIPPHQKLASKLIPAVLGQGATASVAPSLNTGSLASVAFLTKAATL